jgi:hypothetical protein
VSEVQPYGGRACLMAVAHSVACGKPGCKHGYGPLMMVPYTLRQFIKDIRALGWRKTRKHGWVCPVCAGTNPDWRDE